MFGLTLFSQRKKKISSLLFFVSRMWKKGNEKRGSCQNTNKMTTTKYEIEIKKLTANSQVSWS